MKATLYVSAYVIREYTITGKRLCDRVTPAKRHTVKIIHDDIDRGCVVIKLPQGVTAADVPHHTQLMLATNDKIAYAMARAFDLRILDEFGKECQNMVSLRMAGEMSFDMALERSALDMADSLDSDIEVLYTK